MIHFDINLAYPGLTPDDEDRLAELLRVEIQHALVASCSKFIACPGGFLRSQKLMLNGTVSLEEGEPANYGIKSLKATKATRR